MSLSFLVTIIVIIPANCHLSSRVSGQSWAGTQVFHWRFCWLEFLAEMTTVLHVTPLASAPLWEKCGLLGQRICGCLESTFSILSFLQLQMLITSILCYHLPAHNRLRLPWHDFFVSLSFPEESFLPLWWLPLLTLWRLWNTGLLSECHVLKSSEECSLPCSFLSNS